MYIINPPRRHQRTLFKQTKAKKFPEGQQYQADVMTVAACWEQRKCHQALKSYEEINENEWADLLNPMRKQLSCRVKLCQYRKSETIFCM